MSKENAVGAIFKVLQNVSQPDSVYTAVGTVTSIAPLEIQISDRITASGNLLITSPLCASLAVATRGHSHSYSGGTTGQSADTVDVWSGLAVNDKVRMLAIPDSNTGWKYIALWREET